MAIHYIPLTISTSAYSTGDVIGGEIVIPENGTGLLTTLTVYDADGEGVQLDFFFFRGDLTGTTGYTDNVAFAVNSADESKILGVVSVATTDYLAAGNDKIATVTPVNIRTPSGAMRCIIVIRSTTTFTATTDLRLVIGIIEG